MAFLELCVSRFRDCTHVHLARGERLRSSTKVLTPSSHLLQRSTEVLVSITGGARQDLKPS